MSDHHKTILETKNLNYSYEGGKHVLKDVSVKIPAG